MLGRVLAEKGGIRVHQLGASVVLKPDSQVNRNTCFVIANLLPSRGGPNCAAERGPKPTWHTAQNARLVPNPVVLHEHATSDDV